MPPVLKTLLAIILGIVAGGACVALVQTISHSIFGVPDLSENPSYEELATLMDEISLGAKLGVVVSWAVGMIVGTFLAATIADHKSLAAATTLAVLLVFTVMNFFVIPHPTWMMIAPIALALLIWLAVKRYADARQV